jgi:hypothetical protein
MSKEDLEKLDNRSTGVAGENEYLKVRVCALNQLDNMKDMKIQVGLKLYRDFLAKE